MVPFNNTESRVTGELKFVQSDGNPMTVEIGSRNPSSFPFDLNPGGVARFLTRGTGAIKAGWADVLMDGFPEVLSESEVAVFVPGEALGGQVTVRDGQAVGNALLVRNMFAPVVEVRAVNASPAGAFSIEMDSAQAGRAFGRPGCEPAAAGPDRLVGNRGESRVRLAGAGAFHRVAACLRSRWRVSISRRSR